MLRSFVGSALRAVVLNAASLSMRPTPQRFFTSFLTAPSPSALWKPNSGLALAPVPKNLQIGTKINFPSIIPSRSVTKFSLRKGKRKSVKAVLKRFKRLHWGIWIRTRCGRHKRMFKKSPALKRRLRQHVFTNATQSWLLDKMVTSFWRRPKYYVDDPYTPYHTRDEYYATKGKPFKV